VRPAFPGRDASPRRPPVSFRRRGRRRYMSC